MAVSKIERPYQSLFPDFPAQPDAGFHNSIYRGKNLGSSLTEAQSAAIQAGTFEDLFIGDYWEINTRKYRIAGFDVYLGINNSVNFHHAVVVADENMYTSVYGGANALYINSTARASIKQETYGAESLIISAFGDSHVKAYNQFYPSAADTNGVATACSWVDARVELMNENMVYGCQVFGKGGFEVGADKTQLPLFRLNPARIRADTTYWLRNATGDGNVCGVSRLGSANISSPDIARSIRPFFLLN